MILTTKLTFDRNGNAVVNVYTGAHKRAVFRRAMDASESPSLGHALAACEYFVQRKSCLPGAHNIFALPDACDHNYVHEVTS